MARRILGLSCVAGVGIAGVLAVPALATGPTHKNVPFRATAVGASFSRNEAAFKIHDSLAGNGAGVQKITSVSAKGGTDITTAYYRGSTIVAHDTFQLSAPDAHGIIKVTGRCVGVRGTGRLKNLTSHYTFSGTYNTETTVIHVTLIGTKSY